MELIKQLKFKDHPTLSEKEIAFFDVKNFRFVFVRGEKVDGYELSLLEEVGEESEDVYDFHPISKKSNILYNQKLEDVQKIINDFSNDPQKYLNNIEEYRLREIYNYE